MRPRFPFSLLLAVVWFLTTVFHSFAGGGPAGYIVVYNPNDLNSVTIANHYQRVRGIPERNMIPYVFPGSFSQTSAWTWVNTLRAELSARGLNPQLQGVALIGSDSVPMSGGHSAGTGETQSITGFLYLSPNYTSATAPVGQQYNHAYREMPYKPATTLVANRPVNGKTFWPVTFLGHTGSGGNSVREVLAVIDKAKAADGTKPDGTIYWPLGGDDARTGPRRGQIAEVMPIWKQMGIRSTVTYNLWVAGRPDILGGIVGTAAPEPFSGGNVYLPGSWVDHLTSYGGTLTGFSTGGGQLDISTWIRAGAGGSSGTMNEPYNSPGKFTHANIHTYFRMGASLAEAYWQSLNTVAENVALGDPLLQPFAEFPVVAISSPVQSATLNAMADIVVSATPAGTKTLEPDLDFFVDGRRIAVGMGGEPVGVARTPTGFTLNTATIADGWHEFRVVAYNSDSMRTEGEAKVNVFVNNSGQSLSLAGPVTMDRASNADLTILPVGAPGLASIELRLNGRVLGTLGAAGGTVDVSGSKLPMTGMCSFYAVGKFADGREMWSAPHEVTIQWTPQQPVPSPIIATGYAKVRYFAATTTAGFDWSDSTPTVESVYAGDTTYGLYLNGSSQLPPGVTISDYSSSKKPGYEVSMLFYAPADDWYEFAQDLTDASLVNFAVNGQTVSPSTTPQYLASGWHRLRMRATFSKSSWSWKMWGRGGYGDDFRPVAISRAAVEVPGDAPSPGQPPVINSITSSVNPVVTTTVQLTAAASNPGGAESGLTYTWFKMRGPSNSSFSVNGTNASKVTAVTFKNPGNYVFGLRVANATTSTVGTVSLTVQQKATKMNIWHIHSFTPTIPVGAPYPLSAGMVDQFGLLMATQPATISWSVTGNGTVTPVVPSGRSAKFVAAATGSFAPKASATVNGTLFTGTLSPSIQAKTNNLPALTEASVSRDPATGKIILKVRGADADDPDSVYLDYEWSLVSAPAGGALVFDRTDYTTVYASVAGAGNYVVQVRVTDGSGTSYTNTLTFHVNSDSTVPAGGAPYVKTQPISPTLQVGNSTYIFPTLWNHTYQQVSHQWQVSTDGGSSWQNLPGETSNILNIGPVVAEDNGKKFRVMVSNSYGSSFSQPATLTVQAPTAGVVRLSVFNIDVYESAGQAVVGVRRTDGAVGAITLTYRLYPYTATEAVDYSKPSPSSQFGTVSWAAGDSSDKQIVIPLMQDGLAEASEFLSVMLTGIAGGATISTMENEAYVHILDSDSGGIAMDNTIYSVREDQDALTVTLSRHEGTTGSVKVNYTVVSLPAQFGNPEDTATSGLDYTPQSGSFTWSNGDGASKQLVIPILRDTTFEGPETFTVNLSMDGTGGGVGGIETYSAKVTILDAAVQAWQNTWFSGISDTQVIGMEADADGDGRSNLVEYAFGLNPLQYSTEPLPVNVEMGEDRLEITFRRMKEAADVIYRVEAGADLVNWTEIWNSSSIPYGGGESASHDVTVQDTIVIGDPAVTKRFMRVRLTD